MACGALAKMARSPSATAMAAIGLATSAPYRRRLGGGRGSRGRGKPPPHKGPAGIGVPALQQRMAGGKLLPNRATIASD